MELRLYDTLTREKRPFRPLDPLAVRMYVCGPTVYDFAHIGNARPIIVFDVLFRLLRHLYGADHVVYVRNITDVDDKIIARAAEQYPDQPLNDAIKYVQALRMIGNGLIAEYDDDGEPIVAVARVAAERLEAVKDIWGRSHESGRRKR